MNGFVGSRYDQYKGAKLDDLLQALDIDAQGGSDTYQFLENLLRARSAQFVSQELIRSANTINAQLTQTAASIQVSADKIKASLDSTALDLRKASQESSRAASKLNNFTLLLGIGTLLLCLTGCWQAWEAKRQAGLSELQLEVAKQKATPTMPPSRAQGK